MRTKISFFQILKTCKFVYFTDTGIFFLWKYLLSESFLISSGVIMGAILTLLLLYHLQAQAGSISDFKLERKL